MMAPALLDAAAIGLPALLGLVGAWRGFRRALVAWPMRWLLTVFAAFAAAALAVLHLIVHWELASLVYLANAAGMTVVAAIVFIATLILLAMFMDNLKHRIAVWTSRGRVGAAERLFGAVFGMALGLMLIAAPYTLYESLRPDPGLDPAWARDSLSLPYFRSASEAAKSALSSFMPPASGQPPRRQR
jgi:uncharacterized membrane protein required for colicin V production